MLVYCDRCGRVSWNTFKDPNKKCDCCQNLMKILPEGYFNAENPYKNRTPEENKKIYDDLVFPSPNFDEKLFKQMNEKMKQRAQEWKSTPSKPSNVPKCPTCQSTSVEKISLTSKVVGGALFGLFSSNVRNTMHCKNCGYKW